MMHIPESSRGEAFHPLLVIVPICQESASHLSHWLLERRRAPHDHSNGGRKRTKTQFLRASTGEKAAARPLASRVHGSRPLPLARRDQTGVLANDAVAH